MGEVFQVNFRKDDKEAAEKRTELLRKEAEAFGDSLRVQNMKLKKEGITTFREEEIRELVQNAYFMAEEIDALRKELLDDKRVIRKWSWSEENGCFTERNGSGFVLAQSGPRFLRNLQERDMRPSDLKMNLLSGQEVLQRQRTLVTCLKRTGDIIMPKRYA